eukprot:847239-Rhodomonas_salina.7
MLYQSCDFKCLISQCIGNMGGLQDFDRNGEVDPLYLGYTNHLPKTLITSAPTWDAETHLRLRA